MTMKKFEVQLSGLSIPCAVRFPETERYFREFAPKAELCANSAPLLCPEQAEIPEKDWNSALEFGMLDCPHTEYTVLTAYFSDILLRYHRVILHGVALKYQEKAYLICADSGVGKSTQARILQELRPGEFEVICGDRPILQFNDLNDQITVHPSPWNGKENWGSAYTAPLAALILLERGEENQIAPLTIRDAVVPMYTHFIHTGWEPENIQQVAAMESKLLSAVSLWKLTTHDVPNSTKMLLERLFS